MKMNIYFSNLLVNSLYYWKIVQDNVSCVSIEASVVSVEYSGSTRSVMHASIPLQLVPGWNVRMLAMSGNTIKLIACSALLPPTPPPPTTNHQRPTIQTQITLRAASIVNYTYMRWRTANVAADVLLTHTHENINFCCSFIN